MSVAENLKKVEDKISQAALNAGRSRSDIRLIAVTKKVDSDKIREAHSCGVKDFAENYVQEALLKMAALSDLKIDWHLIGNLQSNKVKSIANRFSLLHSVDRESLIGELERRSTVRQDILIEVNLAGEVSKAGATAEEVRAILTQVQVSKLLRVRGLMFMPPLDLSVAEQAQYFAKARKLRDELAKWVSPPHSLVDLSMGTSHDFEVAIREGATLIRLGTVIFGARS